MEDPLAQPPPTPHTAPVPSPAGKGKSASKLSRRARTTYRVLVLLHDHLLPPAPTPAETPELAPIDAALLPYQAELDVLTTLRASGHDVAVLPLASDLAAIEKAVAEHKPQVAFNLIEAFNNYRSFDQHIVGYLECLGVRYTGCNPRGLVLARDKALTKKILAYHRVRVPAFHVFEFGRKIMLPRNLAFPLLVKSATDDGSVGITKASVVHTHADLRDRIAAIHDLSRTDAIAEQFIEGRELYLGVYGNRVAHTLPAWELDLSRLPEGSPKIVTERMKRSLAYQKKYNIDSGPANLTDAEHRALHALGRRVYHLLNLSGYARLDLRMTPPTAATPSELYLIEANPNPQIAQHEDFARSAAAAKIPYSTLLDKLLSLGASYRPVGIA